MKRTGSDSILINKKNHSNEYRSSKYKVNNKYEIKNGNFNKKCKKCRKLKFIDNDPCNNCNNQIFVENFAMPFMFLTCILFVLFTITLPFILQFVFNGQIIQSHLHVSNEIAIILLSSFWLSFMYNMNYIIDIMLTNTIYLIKILIIPFRGNMTINEINNNIKKLCHGK